MQIPNIIQQISDVCHQYKGTVYIVGGSIRDFFMQKEAKDWDLEVHNMTGARLEHALRSIGKTKRVGSSFSVFKLHIEEEEIDVALPQNKSKDAPNMGIVPALRRRDLTINSMAYNIQTHALVDPFHGEKDIQNRILRATDPQTFVEDPLRAFRVAQFAGRYSMNIDPGLISLCHALSLHHIPKERIQIELHKLWLKSETPSIGLLALETLNLYQYLPLWNMPTDPHVLLSVDAFATKRHEYRRPQQLIIFWICALQHTPCDRVLLFLNDLKIFSVEKVHIQEQICSFLMHYPALFENPTDTQIRRFSEIMPLSFAINIMKTITSSTHPKIVHIEQRTRELDLWNASLPQLITAAKLMNMGFVGRRIGMALKKVRNQQIEGHIQSTTEAIQYLQDHL